MTAEILLDELADRGWLADSVLARVRQKLSGRSIDAETVARFLVDKGHLTELQAQELLDSFAEPPVVDPIDEEPGGQITDLPSAEAEAPEDPFDQSDAEESTAERDAKAKKSKRREKRRKKPKKNPNEWDSPLMLLGGGALILLLLCGAGVYYLLLRGSGDELLKVAQAAFDDGSYSQSIAHYEEFLEEFPAHEGGSLARVNLGLARIRQAVEVSSDFEMALERSAQEIPEMQRTEEFSEAQADLSGLLPRIASGLVAKADAAEDLASMNKYVALTQDALKLNYNGKYVPSQKRNKPELERVQEVLKRIARRQEALGALETTLATMESATTSGDIRPAYEAHATLIKEHPELANRTELAEAIASAVAAEQGGVQFVEAPLSASTEEPESPIEGVVATADQRRQGSAPANGQAVFQFQGVVYGVGAADGRLLWRRHVGDDLTGVSPLLSDNTCIVVDSPRKELIRIDAASGDLVWRVALDDDLSQPALLGGRVLVPSKTGRLHVIDLNSGDREGYLQFAQPLLSAPGVSEDGRNLYLVGEHSSVYSLAADSLSCLGVHYLGHTKGSVAAPPTTILGRVLVAENIGLETSRLHVLMVDEQGVIFRRTDSVKLSGLSPKAPVVFGRRMAAVTAAGQILVLEASPDDPSAKLTEMATRRPPRRSPTTHYAQLVDRHFWVAGHGLAKYSIAPTGNRLPISEVRDNFRNDVFVGPLQQRGEVLLHARRRRGKPGLTIGATDTNTGQAYWETDIAVPPAGGPSASLKRGELIQTSATGRVYPVKATSGNTVAMIAGRSESSAGRLLRSASQSTNSSVLLSSTGSDWVFQLQPSIQAKWSQLPDGLASAPTRFADGWLVTLKTGQVHYLHSNPDALPAVPFQPEVMAGAPRRWLPVGVGSVRGEPTAVISNGSILFALRLFEGSPSRLEVISEIEVEQPLTSRVAIADEKAIASRGNGSLAVYDAESLDPLMSTSSGATVAWGPYAVGEKVLITRIDGSLECYDLSAIDPSDEPMTPLWRHSLPDTHLVGKPLVQGSSVLLASRHGGLHQTDLSDGALSTLALGESIASGPRPAGDWLALATPDGSVLFADASNFAPSN